MKTASRLGHLPLLLLALLALLAGLWAGLIRLGWNLPPVQPAWVAEHGPLMISGFLGTLVSLERALALAAVIRSRLPYAAPLLTALGSLALLLGLPEAVGRGLMALGSLALVDIFIVINRRQPNWPHAVMGVGALLWFVGNLLWLVGQPIFRAVPWWLAFLVLTVAGERLELARVLLLRRAAWLSFLACGALVVAGLLLSLAAETAGIQLAGLGLLALGAWLLRFDLARRTVRQTGLDALHRAVPAARLRLAGRGRVELDDLGRPFQRRPVVRRHAARGDAGLHFLHDLWPRAADLAGGHRARPALSILLL